MPIKRIDHIAIVVEKLETALAVYRDALGLPLVHVEDLPEESVKIGFLPTGDSQAGKDTVYIELLEPTSPDSGVARYLAKHGEGLHHICLEVDDLEATLAELKAGGIRLLDESPRPGAHGRIAFIHPKGAHGVLIELVENPASGPAAPNTQ